MDRPPERRPTRSAPGSSPPVEHGPLLPVESGRRIVQVLVVLVAALSVGLALSGPRAVAYPALVRQNLELKDRMQEVEHRMQEVDRILERLRLYDAQIRSLADAAGPSGPIPSEAMSNGGILEYYQDLEEEVRVHDATMGVSDGLPMDGPEPGPIPEGFLRPAESWASGVAERVSEFVDLFEMSEAELTALMADLETLRAIHLALPNTWPADGALTSGFGWRRDPYYRSMRFHSGVDVAGPTGEPVFAAADGLVASSEYTQGYGNMIIIDHGFGISTLYAHCSRREVRVGDRVEAGDRIGRIGSTGRSTGPHLHFELHIDGSAHDPLKYLPR